MEILWMYCFCFFSQFYGGSIGQPIYLCWGTNENWTEFPIAWKSHLFLQFLGNHIPLWLPPRMIRYGKIWVEEVDFFRNNETLKIDGGPFVTEPIVTSYNVPSQGSEKCTMGGRDERELDGKSTFEERNRRYYGFHLSLSIGYCPRRQFIKYHLSHHEKQFWNFVPVWEVYIVGNFYLQVCVTKLELLMCFSRLKHRGCRLWKQLLSQLYPHQSISSIFLLESGFFY